MKVSSRDGQFSVGIEPIGTMEVVPPIKNMEVEADDQVVSVEVVQGKPDKRRVGGAHYHAKITLPCTITRYVPLTSEQVKRML